MTRHTLNLVSGGKPQSRANEALKRAYEGLRALEEFIASGEDFNRGYEDWCLLCGECGATMEIGSLTARVLLPPSCVKCNVAMAIVEKRLLDESESA
jgi:succinylglutamate desuccinylase